MARRFASVMALAGSPWKLVSAWWNVDRIRIPRSRQKDGDNVVINQGFEDAGTARHARARSKAKTTNQ